jgi:predicted nucleic acid-binding protein
VSGFLLDTNCISELVRPRPDRRVLEWLDDADEDVLFLSVLTLGEIRRGVAGLPQGKRRAQLESWLQTELPTRFSQRILPVDAAVADRWGPLTADAKRRGRTLSSVDAWIAATALHHNLTLVSRNVSNFAETPLPVLNLWDHLIG